MDTPTKEAYALRHIEMIAAGDDDPKKIVAALKRVAAAATAAAAEMAKAEKAG